jgi:heterodisulfide reductase subunit A-like polyferredoxin
MDLKNHIPSGPIDQKWDKHRAELKLVNPANKRKFKVIVVGTGLAGSSSAATLAELGYNVEAFTYHHAERTRSLLKVVSMLPRIIRTMATLYGASSMILSRAETSVPAKAMCTDLLRFR